MHFLIVGAQLANKGAESMLYVAVHEIKARFPDAQVYFCTPTPYDEAPYAFRRLHYTPRAKLIALGGLHGAVQLGMAMGADALRWLKGTRTGLGHALDVKRIIRGAAAMIDVSGYALGSKWSKENHISYIRNIQLAQKYGVPMYILPQSFGPFEGMAKDKALMEALGAALRYPCRIYAREPDGYEQLKAAFQLEQVHLSCDMVLQSQGIDLARVFAQPPSLHAPRLTGHSFVGIVPNVQCSVHGDAAQNLRLYEALIRDLLSAGHRVVVFRHSREDLDLCRQLKRLFAQDARVMLEEKEFSCLEYDMYVQQFSYLICSRYHGLVHAYRHGIPCIALGWAVKYQALAQQLGQDRYAFDITNPGFDPQSVLDAAAQLNASYPAERTIILQALAALQKDSCFSWLSGLQG